MDVFRINKEPYHTDPLSTVGSYKYGGRWNPKGIGILYTSRTPELALLETLVHLPPLLTSELPRLWLSTLRLPEDPQTVFWLNPSQLPAYWNASSLFASQTILKEWLKDPFCLAVGVPSVIMPESYNLLLHPRHPAYIDVQLIHQRVLPLDTRLRSGTA